MRRKGFTLLEATCAMGLGLIVLAVGYSAYFSITRADDVESRREMLTIRAHNAMEHIKRDVRSATGVSASHTILTVATVDGPVVYRSSVRGVERIAGRRLSRFPDTSASFAQDGAGVEVSVNARANVHRRVIRVDLDCFVTPRN